MREVAGVKWRAIVLLTTLTVICLLPFADKPFHLDDPVYVRVAQQIHVTPQDFFGFDMYWTGSVEPVWSLNRNPPGMSYAIALAAVMVGWSELALHLAFMLPAAAAVVGTYVLARRACAHPFLAALTMLITPVFLLSSTQLMADTLFLCFWIWAIVFWLQGLEKDQPLILAAAGTFIALACLTKYPGVNLIPLLLAYSLYRQRSIGWWATAFLIPIAALFFYEIYTESLYGEGMVMAAANYATEYAQLHRRSYFSGSLTALSFLGGCLIPVVFYLPWLCSGRRLAFFGIGLIIVAVGLILFGSLKGLEWTTEAGIVWTSVGQISVYVWAGGIILLSAAADFWKHRDSISLLLVLWILGVFVFAAIINWSVNGRSLLPLAPAVAIVLVRWMEAGRGMFTLGRPAGILMAAGVAALFAMIPVNADYLWAKSARLAALEVNQTRQEGQRILFEGHWGFQWYMQSLGAEVLDPSRLRSGDLIVVPMNNSNVRLAVPRRRLAEFRRQSFPGPKYAATISASLGAGFYSDVWGPLPFALGPVPPEEYVLVRVR